MSGLILTRNFPVTDGLQLSWRWRADVLPAAKVPTRRAGDDFAVGFM
jgi:hypothetical protein